MLKEISRILILINEEIRPPVLAAFYSYLLMTIVLSWHG
jgi:hypothetical protein